MSQNSYCSLDCPSAEQDSNEVVLRGQVLNKKFKSRPVIRLLSERVLYLEYTNAGRSERRLRRRGRPPDWRVQRLRARSVDRIYQRTDVRE
jgi:hypothetical protein